MVKFSTLALLFIIAGFPMASEARDPVDCFEEAVNPFGDRMEESEAIDFCKTVASQDPLSCYQKATNPNGARLSKEKAMRLCQGKDNHPN